MKRTTLTYTAASLAVVLAAGCATAGRDTAIGALAGTAAGAGVGALVGGKKGALVGAGVGAVAGGSVGLYLDKQRKELEAAKVAEIKQTENGLLLQMKNDILFDVNSDAVKPQGLEDLTKMGDILAKYSDNRVQIHGHTDSTGDAVYNQKFSERRATAVKTVLVGRGVQESQVIVTGFGKTKPIADNGTADGRSKNRRVELHIDVPNPS
jgi:outer membrane protein OmpA-like peptidoglycan-associated protein